MVVFQYYSAFPGRPWTSCEWLRAMGLCGIACAMPRMDTWATCCVRQRPCAGPGGRSPLRVLWRASLGGCALAGGLAMPQAVTVGCVLLRHLLDSGPTGLAHEGPQRVMGDSAGGWASGGTPWRERSRFCGGVPTARASPICLPPVPRTMGEPLPC